MSVVINIFRGLLLFVGLLALAVGVIAGVEDIHIEETTEQKCKPYVGQETICTGANKSTRESEGALNISLFGLGCMIGAAALRRSGGSGSGTPVPYGQQPWPRPVPGQAPQQWQPQQQQPVQQQPVQPPFPGRG